MMFVWVLLLLLTPSPMMGECFWSIKALYSANGNLNIFHKSVPVRSPMHCVHLCLSISRCNDVYFSRFKCVMFTNLQVESLKRCFGVFSPRKIVWPQKFVLHQTRRTNGRLAARSRVTNPRKSPKKQTLVAGSADKTTEKSLETYHSDDTIQSTLAHSETTSLGTKLVPTLNLGEDAPTLKRDGRHISDDDWKSRTNTQTTIKQINSDGEFMHGLSGKVIEPKQENGSMTKQDGANDIPFGNVIQMSSGNKNEPGKHNNLDSNSDDEEMRMKAVKPIKNQEQINGTHHNKSDKIPRGSLSIMEQTSQGIQSNALTVYNDHHVNVSTPPTVDNTDGGSQHLNSHTGEATDEQARYQESPNTRSDKVNVNDQTTMSSLHISTKTGANESPTAGTSLKIKREKFGLTPSSNTNPSIRTETVTTPISGLRRKKRKEDHHGTPLNANPNNRMGTKIGDTPNSNLLPTGHLESKAGQGFSSTENSNVRVGPKEATATYARSSLKPSIHKGNEVTQTPISGSLPKNQVGKEVGQRSTSNLYLTSHMPTDGSQELTSKSVLGGEIERADVTPNQGRFTVNMKSKQGKAVIPDVTNNTTIRGTSETSSTKPVQQTSTKTTRSLPTTEVNCPLWPEHKLRPPPTRSITKDTCEQHDGYTFLTNTSMCIKYIEKKYTWLQARTRCWKESGDLVLIDTEEKKADCHNFLLKLGKVPVFNIKRYWIGLQIAPCGMRWVDGSPFLFNWVKRHQRRILCVCAIAEAFKRVIRRNCKTPADSVMCEIV